MNERVTIMFPNEGEYDLCVDLVKKWKIISCETIGDTNFCKTVNGSLFSIPLIEYNKIFKS